MKEIKKKICTSTCYGQFVNENGEFEDYKISLIGRYTPITATKAARRFAGDSTITINKVEEDCNTFKMNVEDFIASAVRETTKEKED